MSVSTGVCVGLSIMGFILGAILSSLILICVPNVYRKLTSCFFRSRIPCSRSKETRAGEVSNVNPGSRKSDQYSEIDEKKTRTFSPKKPLTLLDEVSESDGQRYEDCVVGGKPHSYSDLDVVNPNKNGKVTYTPTTCSYEEFSPGKKINTNENVIPNHEYFILEPNSDKRLPVKLLEKKSDTLPCDPDRVYFKLEPGTNKVTPLSHNFIAGYTKGSSEQTLDRDSGHIYFVLEPMAESADSEILPYAVNDVAANPPYFLLEKTDRSI